MITAFVLVVQTARGSAGAADVGSLAAQRAVEEANRRLQQQRRQKGKRRGGGGGNPLVRAVVVAAKLAGVLAAAAAVADRVVPEQARAPGRTSVFNAGGCCWWC